MTCGSWRTRSCSSPPWPVSAMGASASSTPASCRRGAVRVTDGCCLSRAATRFVRPGGVDTNFDIVDGLMSVAKARAAGAASWCQAPTRPIKDSHWPRSRWRLCPEPDPCIVQSRGLLLWWQRRLPAGCLLSAAKPMTLTGSSPTAQPRSALRLARAAAGVPISTAAAVCGLTDRTLRKHLRNLPARGRCAATVAALAAAQRLPGPPDRAAVTHRACPPPAVRAARPGDLDAVAAAAGSASWALAHLPIRGGGDERFLRVQLRESAASQRDDRLGRGQRPLLPQGASPRTLCARRRSWNNSRTIRTSTSAPRWRTPEDGAVAANCPAVHAKSPTTRRRLWSRPGWMPCRSAKWPEQRCRCAICEDRRNRYRPRRASCGAPLAAGPTVRR